MNTKLLRKIKKHIQEEPKRWTFNWVRQNNESPCGTQACIAGWAMVLSGKITAEEYSRQPRVLSLGAAQLLDITKEEAERLFIYWPERFRKLDSKAACDRIDFFLKTKGTDVLPVPKPRKLSTKEKT